MLICESYLATNNQTNIKEIAVEPSSTVNPVVVKVIESCVSETHQ